MVWPGDKARSIVGALSVNSLFQGGGGGGHIHLLVGSLFHTRTVASEEPDIVLEPSPLIRTAFTSAV